MACNGTRFIRNLCMALFFFFSGVEYAVILPTINGYLDSMGATATFLGLCLAAFSFPGLIAGPIYGRITDRTGSAKVCVIAGDLFEIGGNLMYFMSSNKYMVLGARLISGTGTGAASSILGTISKTTTEEERTSVFSLLMSMRQIGLLVGPAFNLFLSKLDFKIGRFHVDQYTSPGLFMVIIWTTHALLFLFAYKEVGINPIKPEESPDAHEEIGEHSTITRKIRSTSVSIQRGVSFAREFLREEVVVCLAANFLIMFSQTGLEGSLTPLTLLFFGWGGLYNSFFFCGAGFIVICSFAALGLLSRKYSDRALFLTGCFGMIVTYVLFFISNSVLLYKYGPNHTPVWLLPSFCITTAVMTISLPFVFVPQASLFSKVTRKETQAFNQGVRLVTMRMGQIIGPLWGSSMATLERLQVMIGVNLGLIVMLTGMVRLSYRHLQPPPKVRVSSSNAGDVENDVGEESPLLRKGTLDRHSVINS